jgi:hypothetical protein
MVTARFFETWETMYRTTENHIPEDHYLNEKKTFPGRTCLKTLNTLH